MTVRVEAHDEGIGPEARRTLAERAARLIKDSIGVTATVEVCEPHELERSLGKAKRISDQRAG
jgi:phenylacetate-CoA ligase